ncbi:MAG: hypothetical protein ACI9JN_001045 [Bacteroidia bacterium]|jgi:hypothetical protein
MKTKVYPLFNLSVILLIVLTTSIGCVTGKKRFEQGDYDAATLQAIKRLRNNPDSKKARQYLPIAYEYALDYHLNAIKQAKLSSDRFKWDNVVSHYNQLNGLYNQIAKCPACLDIIKTPRIFQREYDEAKLVASKNHFEAGVAALRRYTKESGREAFHQFSIAKDYTPKYTSIDTYLDSALYLGTIHVLIQDIPVHSRRLTLTNEFFQNSIIEHVSSLNYTFVRFYREADVNRNEFIPDQVVVMQFDDFVVGQTFVKERVETLQKDSVEIGIVKTSEGEKPVYGTVKAELTTFVKTLTSSGLLDFQIVNANTGATIQQRKLPGTFVWSTDWATYNGQEEALTSEQLTMTKRREAFPPSPQDLFIEFTQPIYTQVINSLNKYYRVYN